MARNTMDRRRALKDHCLWAHWMKPPAYGGRCQRGQGAPQQVREERAMTHHTVESCPDDLEMLGNRLDELAQAGSRILTVLWQPTNVVEEQSAAIQGRGSFVIISLADSPDVLRDR